MSSPRLTARLRRDGAQKRRRRPAPDVDHRVLGLDARRHRVLDEQQSALGGVAVGDGLVDLDHAELDGLPIVWPSNRRIVELVSLLSDLSDIFELNRPVADAFLDLFDEILRTCGNELVLGEILGAALGLKLVAHIGDVAFGIGELEGVDA